MDARSSESRASSNRASTFLKGSLMLSGPEPELRAGRRRTHTKPYVEALDSPAHLDTAKTPQLPAIARPRASWRFLTS